MQDKMIVNKLVASCDFDESNFESRSIVGCIKIYTPLAYYKTVHLHASDQQRRETNWVNVVQLMQGCCSYTRLL